jgi:hypothetical protein
MYTPQHGLTAIRYLKSLAVGKGDHTESLRYAEQQKNWGSFDREIIIDRFKASVSGLALSDVGGGSQVGHDFLAALRPLTIIGRLEKLRRIPARVPMLTQTVGSVAGWKQNGGHRVLSAGEYARENLPLLSVGSMCVASNELLADGSWEAENELLKDLLSSSAEALDRAFADPANEGVADAIPASVTCDATPIYLDGSTIADLDEALGTAIRQLVAAGSNLSGGAWVMSHDTATAMGLARGASGALAFPTVGANGGILCGLPVLTSASVQPDSDGGLIALLDASQISYTEDAPTLSVSRNASIEMSTAPSGSTTPPTAAATLVSMFQADATALLASMACNWKLRRENCTQVIGGVPTTLTAA